MKFGVVSFVTGCDFEWLNMVLSITERAGASQRLAITPQDKDRAACCCDT